MRKRPLAEVDVPLLNGKNGKEIELKFSNDYKKRDYRLLEVPKELETELLKGANLRLVGSDSGKLDAVICTASQTYSIKKVETSNSVCLIAPGDEGNVVATCPYFYELLESKPTFTDVEQRLQQTVYRGADLEEMYPPDKTLLMTREEMAGMMLASEEEVAAALTELNVIEIDGFMRIMSKDAKWDLAKKLINEIVLADLNFDAIDDADLRRRLAESEGSVDYTLFAHTLADLGTLRDGRWVLQRDRLATTAAHVVFREDSKKFHEKEAYMTAWELSLPKGVRARDELLDGVALSVAQHAGGSEAFYTYLPAAEAGETVGERFRHVFAVKAKLTRRELRPYLLLQDADEAKEDELLVQYTNPVDGAFTLKI